MQKETIKILNGCDDDIQCVCGNRVYKDGFYPCDIEGNEVKPLADLQYYFICAKCGRMFDELTYNEEAQTYDVIAQKEFKPLE